MKTILLGVLVRCGSPLKIEMAVWHSFFGFEARQTAIIVCSGLPHQTQQVQIQKYVLQKSITIWSGLLYPTGWAAQPSEDKSQRFFQGQEKPSEDMIRRLYISDNYERVKIKSLHGSLEWLIDKWYWNVTFLIDSGKWSAKSENPYNFLFSVLSRFFPMSNPHSSRKISDKWLVTNGGILLVLLQ